MGEPVIIEAGPLIVNLEDGLTSDEGGSVIVAGDGLESNQEDSASNNAGRSANMDSDEVGEATVGMITTDTVALVSSTVFQSSFPSFIPATSIQQLAANPLPASSAVNSNKDALIGASAVARAPETDDGAATDVTINFGAVGSTLRVMNDGVRLPEHSVGANQ